MSVEQLLDYIWVPILGLAVTLWAKIHSHGTRIALLEQAQTHHDLQRREDRVLRDAQREEILARMQANHKEILAKLDG